MWIGYKALFDGKSLSDRCNVINGAILIACASNQSARIILEKKGASGWINGDRTTFHSRYQVSHRPDGLITLPDGTVIAIETERRLKTKALTNRSSPAIY